MSEKQLSRIEEETFSVSGIEQNYTAKLHAGAAQIRQEAMEQACLIINVSSDEDQTEVVEVTAKLKGWLKQVDKAFDYFKAPILAAGRVLDALKKKESGVVELEIKRLQGLLADWHNAQEKKRQDAILEQQRIEAEARAEQARKDKEAADAAAEIERQRLEAERKSTEAKTKKAREEAAIEAKRLADIQQAKEFESDFAEPAPMPVYVPPPVVVKPSGAAVKKTVKFEVTDIKALYQAFPHLVELTPKTAQINYHINTPGVDTNIPGLRVWDDTTVVVRAS